MVRAITSAGDGGWAWWVKGGEHHVRGHGEGQVAQAVTGAKSEARRTAN